MDLLPKLQTERVVVQLMPLLARTSLTGTPSNIHSYSKISVLLRTSVQSYINNNVLYITHGIETQH